LNTTTSAFLEAHTGTGPKTLNPWAAFDASSSALGGMTTCSLVSSDPYSGEVIPWLAKTVEVVSPTTLRITLRQGLHWSDGHPLTLADVLFTWNTLIAKGLGNPSTRDALLLEGRFPLMKAVGPYTATISTHKPFAPLLRQLGVALAPQHVLGPLLAKAGPSLAAQDAALSATWTTQEAQQHPEHWVGCGPWRLQRYVPGEYLLYQRNPYYFVVNQKGQRLPYLSQLSVRLVKDPNALQLLFEQGQLHTLSVSPSNLPRLRAFKRLPFELYNLGASDNPTFLAFNFSRRKDDKNQTPLVNPQASEVIHSLAFRQAIEWAVDRERLVASVLKGIGQPLFTAEGLNSLYVEPQLAKGHPHNLAHAKALLQKGGFHFTPQGRLLSPSGWPVTLNLMTNADNPEREQVGVLLQQGLKALGVNVQLSAIEFNTMLSRLHEGRWELVVMGLSGGSTFEPHFAANVWKSDGALHLMNQRPLPTEGAPAAADDRLPWEKQLDALFEQGVQVLTPAQRRPIYWQYQRVVAQHVPVVYLFSGKTLWAVRRNVANVYPTPLAGGTPNMESLWITP
jgi:peptide/nickel transport system substrate-binding protein